MPTATFSVAVEIDAPPQRVFAYLADLPKHGEWSANPLSIDSASPGPVGVGSRYRSSAEFNGLQFVADLRVTIYDPPSRFGFGGQDSTGRFEHQFKLTPQARGTRVERRVSFQLTPAQWLMFLILLYPVRLPAARRALTLLKDRLEQLPA